VAVGTRQFWQLGYNAVGKVGEQCVQAFYQQLKNNLVGGQPGLQNEGDFFRSAVFLPLVEQNGQPGILFEVRAASLAWQPGEICFPGGRIEPIDATAQAAAVRETCEELSLKASGVKVLGQMDFVVTPLGLLIYPFVGYISEVANVRPSASEVAEVFVVPLKFFLETEPLVGTVEVATRPQGDFPIELVTGYPSEWKKRSSYKVFFYRYHERVIWGITAGIVNNFIQFYRKCKEIKI